ncbi:MAG: cache domain-containing protein, partial [Anaerolineales bacterium]|nr:cache domain-containing protein [Anaerolineales bacterium]
MTKENPATTEWVGLRPGTSLYPNVTRTMALMLAAAGAYTLFSVYLALQTPTWQLIGQTVLMVLYCLAAVAAGWWARRGRLTAAGLTVIGALLPTTLGITALIEGLGLVMGTIAVTLTALVAALSLPRRLTPRLIWLSVAAGLAAVLGDLYLPLPWVRGQVPALRVAAPLIAGLLAAAYILLVARQFRHYSLRTKLIITFVVVTVLPVAAVGYLTDRAARVALTASADQTLLASAAQTAGRLDAFIEQWSNEVRNEATYADFVDYLARPADQRSGSAAEARARTLLRALGRKDDANIASYALLDATGLNVLDTLASRRGLDESGRSYFREPFQSGMIYVSPIEISMSTGEP